MINEQVGNQAGITFTSRRKWDTKSRLLASVDRAKELIGYQPNTPFEKGLDNAIAWFQDNWERISAAASFGPASGQEVAQFNLGEILAEAVDGHRRGGGHMKGISLIIPFEIFSV